MAAPSKRLSKRLAWTNVRWEARRDRAGKHCQQVHQAVVQQGHLDLLQVQAEAMRVKGHTMSAWMGLAMMVSTRLWLGGVVSLTRDRSLADRLLRQVRSCCQPRRARLGCTDGWNVYPGSIRRAFREKVKETAGRGRACLQVWPQVCIAVVIKRTAKKRVVEITRKLVEANAGASAGTAFSFSWRDCVQYRLYRALEREHAPATRQLDAQVPACGPAPGSARKRHVAAWLYVQFLLAPS